MISRLCQIHRNRAHRKHNICLINSTNLNASNFLLSAQFNAPLRSIGKGKVTSSYKNHTVKVSAGSHLY